jgi:predicted outer membrane repeat protein
MARRQRRRREQRRRVHAQREGWKTRHSVVTGAGLAAGASLAIASPALGAPLYLTVNQSGDAGDGTCDASCTLRDAVGDANDNAGQYDYIYFSSSISGSTLSAGQIEITDSVGIYGNGPASTTISAAPDARIFEIDPTTPGAFVGLSHIKLTDGDVTGKGGAIYSYDARLGIFDAVISGNTATGAGGAIYGAGNYASGQYDRISYSTFYGNHAGIAGGAVFAASSWGVVRSATFVGNSADGGYGGAVSGVDGYIVDSTISGNHASDGGGGVSVDGLGLGLFGTILANNTAGIADPDLHADGGTAAFNLVENPGTTGIDVLPTIITGQDPQLGGLADNGGPAPTLKPAAASPVVDQAYSYSYYDQRFFDRPVDNPNRANVPDGNGADIGSVELTLAEGPQAAPPPTPPQVTPRKRKCKKKKKKRSAEAAKKKKCKKKRKRSAAVQPGFRFAMPPKSPGWAQAGDNPFRLRR